jgi:hypothetical protein
MEIWKDVVGYEWKYQVSNMGNIKWPTWYMHPTLGRGWYLLVKLSKVWKRSTEKMHRLVAKAFIPNPENKPTVNHKHPDWDKTINTVENLEWATYSENELHSVNVLWKKATWLWKFWKEHKNSKKIWQYKLDWEFVKERWWAREVERGLWIRHEQINHCCLWSLKTSHWYIRKYI